MTEEENNVEMMPVILPRLPEEPGVVGPPRAIQDAEADVDIRPDAEPETTPDMKVGQGGKCQCKPGRR